MEFGRKLAMMMGMGGKKENPALKQEEGEAVLSHKSLLDAHTLHVCYQAIKDESTNPYVAGRKDEHGVNYLHVLPDDVQEEIMKLAHVEMKGVAPRDDIEKWGRVVDATFDKVLPEWREWFMWKKIEEEERRKKSRS